jgi:hypothetical protein
LGAPYEVVFPLVRKYFSGKGEATMNEYFLRERVGRE